jgi:hypothetical protein
VSRFATPAELRSFMEWTGSTGRKSDVNLGLLLDAASDYLEAKTGRTITSTGSNTSRTYSTQGRPFIIISDWRTITSVTLAGSPLVADESYWAIPSRQASDITVAIQLRSFGSSPEDVRSGADWFDTNKDHWLYPGAMGGSSLPNDLVVTGLGGWTSVPASWKLASLSLAGYYYNHADALFSGARQSPEGNIYDLSSLPSEVRELISSWNLGDSVVVI